MNQTSNSAQQLYSILRQAWEYSEDSNIATIWGTLLEADPKNQEDISDKFGQLIELFNDTKNDINQLENINTDRYLKAINSIQTVLISRNSISGEWKSIKNAIREEALELIGSCADVMASQKKVTLELSSEVLKDLYQEIQDLIETLIDSDLDSSFKHLIIKHLKEIGYLILNYRIRGSSGLERVIDQTAGSLLLRLFTSDGSQIKGKESILKVMNWIIKANSLISVYERAKGLPEQIIRLLSLPPGGS